MPIQLPPVPMIRTSQGTFYDVIPIRTQGKMQGYYIFKGDENIGEYFFGSFIGTNRVYARRLSDFAIPWLYLCLWIPYLSFPKGFGVKLWRHMDVSIIDGNVRKAERSAAREVQTGYSALIKKLWHSKDY